MPAYYYLLVSSNRDYEIDAFLEVFAACSERSVKAELFGIIGEGRALLTLHSPMCIDVRRFIDEMMARKNSFRYLKKAKAYSMIAKSDELPEMIEKLRSDLNVLADDAKIAISIQGIGLTGHFEKDVISKILEGIRINVDLDNPNILVGFFFFGDYFLMDPALPLSVPNIEHRRGLSENV